MLAYYIRKLHNTLLTRYATPLADRQVGPGLLSGAVGDFRFRNRIVFYFADTQYVHLGDQLFHQPLLTLWSSHGFDIRVATSSALAPYFTSQGLRLLASSEYGEIEGAVIVTKNDLARAVSELFPRGNFFVGVNYHQVEYPGPICVGLARAVYAALERLRLDLPALPDAADELFQPYVPHVDIARSGRQEWRRIIAEDESACGRAGQGYLVYNDFVSSAYLEARMRERIIREQGWRWKAAGYRLIYAGSERERLARPSAPEFVDLDLRGAMSAMELYDLFALPSVHGVICYDTFIMHVASALRRELYVTMKKRGRDWQAYRRRYIPMYPGADELVQECL